MNRRVRAQNTNESGRYFRRRGSPNRSRPAKAMPPVNLQRGDFMSAPLVVVEAVVVTVRVVLPLPPAASCTLVGLRVHAGRCCAPDGVCVRVQVRFNFPEEPAPAFRVPVEVAVPPAETGAGVEVAM